MQNRSFPKLRYSTFNILHSLFKELLTNHSKLISFYKLLPTNYQLLFTNHYILITIFLLGGAGVGYAQDIDSLKLALKIAKHDTTKAKLLNQITETCPEEDIIKYAKPCADICEKNLLGSINSKSRVTYFYREQLANALNNIGYYYYNRGELNKGIEFYEKSLEIGITLVNLSGAAQTLLNIGFHYYNQGNISRALEYYFKALKIQEKLNDKNGMASSYINIGAIYEHQGDINKSLHYYNLTLKLDNELKNNRGVANALINIGNIYYAKGDCSTALNYFLKSLEIRQKESDLRGVASSYNNLGAVYRKMSENLKGEAMFPQKIKYTNQALFYFKESLILKEKFKDKRGVTLAHANLAQVYIALGQLSEATYHAKISLASAKELGYPSEIRNASNSLSIIYKKQKNYKAALEMYELEIQMRDSINNAETKKASIKKQFQYQYEKKAAADSVKNAEEQKVKNAQLTAQQAQLKQEKTQRFALYGGLILVIAFSGFVFNRFKITQKQKKIIEAQKHEVDSAYERLHEKNKEVMDSIHYAARIQRSLITSEKYIAQQIKRLRKL